MRPSTIFSTHRAPSARSSSWPRFFIIERCNSLSPGRCHRRRLTEGHHILLIGPSTADGIDPPHLRQDEHGNDLPEFPRLVILADRLIVTGLVEAERRKKLAGIRRRKDAAVAGVGEVALGACRVERVGL